MIPISPVFCNVKFARSSYTYINSKLLRLHCDCRGNVYLVGFCVSEILAFSAFTVDDVLTFDSRNGINYIMHIISWAYGLDSL
jgi:hypothetical protein